eukprot:7353748-Prymnesium_polylepis.1
MGAQHSSIEVARLPAEDASRYFSVLVPGHVANANDGSDGEVWLLARTGEWPSAAMRNVRTQLWRSCDALLFSGGLCTAASHIFLTRAIIEDYRQKDRLQELRRVACGVPANEPLCRDESLSHNAAVALHHGSLLLVGGRYSNNGKPFHYGMHAGRPQPALNRGVHLYQLDHAAELEAAPNASRWKVKSALDRLHPGCVEMRPQYTPYCEYDGKMSLSSRARSPNVIEDDEWFLYARANLVGGSASEHPTKFGGRHVQVSEPRERAN